MAVYLVLSLCVYMYMPLSLSLRVYIQVFICPNVFLLMDLIMCKYNCLFLNILQLVRESPHLVHDIQELQSLCPDSTTLTLHGAEKNGTRPLNFEGKNTTKMFAHVALCRSDK